MAGTINKPKKPKSKRTPTRLRNKIEKAAAAKQRKTRKLAKKNPEWRSKLKRDPGIPNLFPYKEKLLQQIEDDRIRRKEEQQRRREQARTAKAGDTQGAEEGVDEEMQEEEDDEFVDSEERDDKESMDEDGSDVDESNPMAALLASARRAAEKYNRELHSVDEMDGDDDDGRAGSGDDGEPDVIEVSGGATSRKAYDKVFKQVVEQADVVLYVLDARDPESTRSRDVERSVLAAAGGGKRLILVLNKVDLVPPPVLRGWLAYLRRSFPTLPLRASGPAPNAQTFNHRNLTVQSTSAALFRALKAFAASRNLKRAISVGVIGYPNVGKSSVINSLLSRLNRGQQNACPAGAEAGVTTSIRAVKIDNKLTLLDSPGIVFPSSPSIPATAARGNSGTGAVLPLGAGDFVPKNKTEAHAHLVLLNAVPPKQIDDPVPAVTLLLKRLAPLPDMLQKLTAVYDLPPLLVDPHNGDATTDFLVQVARKRGRLGRGGVPNTHAAAMTVVTDWRDGRIQGWVDAPALPDAGGEAAKGGASMADHKEIVTEWAKEFKIEDLWGDDGGGGDAASNEVEMQ